MIKLSTCQALEATAHVHSILSPPSLLPPCLLLYCPNSATTATFCPRGTWVQAQRGLRLVACALCAKFQSKAPGICEHLHSLYEHSMLKEVQHEIAKQKHHRLKEKLQEKGRNYFPGFLTKCPKFLPWSPKNGLAGSTFKDVHSATSQISIHSLELSTSFCSNNTKFSKSNCQNVINLFP